MKKLSFVVVLALALLAGIAPTAQAAPSPTIIDLPNGFSPEGVAVMGNSLFVGSIPTGAIYKANTRTGAGDVLVPGQPGRAAIGLSVQASGGRLWVAGGGTGQGYVYDTTMGETLSVLDLTAPGTFVNDVIVTGDAAYFTDSFLPQIYKVALDGSGLPESIETIAFTGDWQQVPGFNANGIEAFRGGQTLTVVNSSTGELYTVDPDTGATALISTDGFDVTAGDGLARRGNRLYVVQNRFNQIVELKLNADLSSASLVETITSSDFDVPTTVAVRGSTLYAVNARFGTPPGPTTTYTVAVVKG